MVIAIIILRQRKGKGGSLTRIRRRFTLIELLVVIAIISILMAILMPALKRVHKNSPSHDPLKDERTDRTIGITLIDLLLIFTTIGIVIVTAAPALQVGGQKQPCLYNNLVFNLGLAKHLRREQYDDWPVACEWSLQKFKGCKSVCCLVMALEKVGAHASLKCVNLIPERLRGRQDVSRKTPRLVS